MSFPDISAKIPPAVRGSLRANSAEAVSLGGSAREFRAQSSPGALQLGVKGCGRGL